PRSRSAGLSTGHAAGRRYSAFILSRLGGGACAAAGDVTTPTRLATATAGRMTSDATFQLQCMTFSQSPGQAPEQSNWNCTPPPSAIVGRYGCCVRPSSCGLELSEAPGTRLGMERTKHWTEAKLCRSHDHDREIGA